MKFCPNCGTPVEPGAESCESCGTDLAAAQSVLASSTARPVAVEPGAATDVSELSPRQLRKEIRWGAFQGIVLAGAIVLVVYLVVVLLIAGVITTTVSGGG